MRFYQWLKQYELITKNDYETFQKEVQDNLKREYKMWLKNESQYNSYE